MTGNDREPEARVRERMREDWNRRAREDPHYYVAFGRRGQDDKEFFATSADVVRSLEQELKRLPVEARGRALEIGCGPGRLMRPISRHFSEIHGVDVSDEMIRLAREKLRGVGHAVVHHTEGADLALFPAEYFDFVYSYAVFQHIPSREVVFSYLRDSVRVLRPGGLMRCQLNGLPETAVRYDTWSGVRIGAAEITAFAREHKLQLLALEGTSTQYMWVTVRKRAPGDPAREPAHIRRVTNTHTSEPVVPNRGRFASAALWVEDLPEDCDLLGLEARIGGVRGTAFYIGPPEADGLRQVNVTLPTGVETGLQQLELFWEGAPLCAPACIRVIRPGPTVPRVVAVTDAIDLLSRTRIVSGWVKVTLEEVERPEDLQAWVGGEPAGDVEIFCVDPLPPRFEVNIRAPERAGVQLLELKLGRRRLAPVELEIVA